MTLLRVVGVVIAILAVALCASIVLACEKEAQKAMDAIFGSQEKLRCARDPKLAEHVDAMYTLLAYGFRLLRSITEAMLLTLLFIGCIYVLIA